MKLPIDVIPNTKPPKFKWTQIFDTYGTPRVVQCEGVLPAAVEKAVVALIEHSKQTEMEFIALRTELEEARKRIDELSKAVIPQGQQAKRAK